MLDMSLRRDKSQGAGIDINLYQYVNKGRLSRSILVPVLTSLFLKHLPIKYLKKDCI